jgi:16S rRNA (cytosine967-C5)-methyltransferase
VTAADRTLAPDSLAYALLFSARACAEVRAGRAVPEVLEALRANVTVPSARGAIQDLCYRTMRLRGTADALVDAFCTRRPEPALLRELLCVAISLLDVDPAQEPGPRYTPFTVVDQAVAAAAADPGLMRARGVVNAILRSVLREGGRVASVLAQDEVARLNYPAWWVTRIREAYPGDWLAILASAQRPAPLTLRVNRRRSNPEQYLRALQASGQSGTQVGPSAVRLARARPVAEITGFSEGWVSVQDEAAQRAAPLCDVRDGMRVLDACAAPGGKTAHLLEIAELELIALDTSATRLARVSDNLVRLGLGAQLVCADARAPGTWWDGRPFDRVLADVPCTASGIVRRHPDIRWLRREADIGNLSRLQQQILDALWRLVAPGGKLVLVTCSLFPQEAELLARGFELRHADAVRAPAPGQLLPHAGRDADHDGLFYALFEKSA